METRLATPKAPIPVGPTPEGSGPLFVWGEQVAGEEPRSLAYGFESRSLHQRGRRQAGKSLIRLAFGLDSRRLQHFAHEGIMKQDPLYRHARPLWHIQSEEIERQRRRRHRNRLLRQGAEVALYMAFVVLFVFLVLWAINEGGF